MARSVRLDIGVDVDAANGVRGLNAVGDAAKSAGGDLNAAGRDLDEHSRRLKVSSEATDELATKSSVMTGALGAIGGGLQAVGLEKYGLALQGAAVATDTVSGFSDIFTLTLQSQRLASIKAAVSTRAHAVATRGLSIAQKGAAVATRVLNAAMRANPIGLVITAITLAVAAFVILYKRSETFRSGVQAVGRVGKAAFQGIRDAIGWVIDKLKPLGSAIGRAAGLYLKFNPLKLAFDGIKSAVDAVSGAVETLIGWIKKIHIPKISLPDIPGVGFAGLRTMSTASTQPVARGLLSTTSAQPRTLLGSGTSSTSTGGGRSGFTIVNNITINGVLDGNDAARKVNGLLRSRGRQLGYATAAG